MKIYKITDECIACHACVEVAPDNFDMGEEIAYIKKQPENADEESFCQDALEVCPVNAILSEEGTQDEVTREPILARDNVKKTLDAYPQLKDVLVGLSDKFQKLLNPTVYNTVAKFATFNDAARVTKVSVCEILHTLNEAIGTKAKLLENAPDCVKTLRIDQDLSIHGTPIFWEESNERYIYNADSMPELIEKVAQLGNEQNIVLIAVDEPIELVKTAQGLGFEVNIETGREYRVSIFNPNKEKPAAWRERKDKFAVLDVRSMQTDPFDVIIKKAYATPEDDGFILIQSFEPYPLVNMLTEMGFEYESAHVSPSEVWGYFYKTPVLVDDTDKTDKTELVIQSATPVAYPVIMRLLQSEVLRKNVAIKELKIWEETEKHLAWISNGKADISFSALLTSLKLQKLDIKIPALFVWDNFVILTRYKATSFEDIKGKDIYTPLFASAPPTKITKYLIKAKGYDPADFNFVFGEPFGRPEEIYAAFVQGEADTVVLREPEASYALKIMQDRGEEVSILSYNKMWNEVNPGFGSFPNAGIVLKGEFVRNNPELTEVFLEELKKAIDWVNENKKESARLSFDMMRQPADRIELFLDRVNFDYVSGEVLVDKIKEYFKVLVRENIVDDDIEDAFYDTFMLE